MGESVRFRVRRALEILERNRRLLAGGNPGVWAAAALYLASYRQFGLLRVLLRRLALLCFMSNRPLDK